MEVTLSPGIISFAFVSLFGLLGVGLTNFNGAADSSVASQIAQRAVTSARQASTPGSRSDFSSNPPRAAPPGPR